MAQAQADAAIHIDPSRMIAQVDDRIFSTFIEHLGRCVYGGIYSDPEFSTRSDVVIIPEGFRTDVLDLVTKELKPPVVRWPGGNFASTYHWQDGVGPKDQRPATVNPAWGGDESNHFGTDEFIKWCRLAKTEPYICLNMGNGTLQEALDWLEYCNGIGDTLWAKQRRANNPGEDEPHGVKYWALGNELYGEWQEGHMSAEEYVLKAREWAKALKQQYPSIILVSCGQNGFNAWDATVLQGVASYVDFHSIHFYSSFGERDRTGQSEYSRRVFGPEAAEAGIRITQRLIELASIESKVPASKVIKIAFDEWGVWDETKGTPKNGLQQIYSFTDALAMASWLNVFIRNAGIIGVANYAQLVNVIAPIITSTNGLCKQTIYHSLHLFSQYMRGGSALQLHVDSPNYDGETLPDWVQGRTECRYVDVSGVISDSGRRISLAIVNRHPTRAFLVRFVLTGIQVSGDVDVHELFHHDLDAVNSFEQPDEVKIVTTRESWSNPRAIREHSFTLLIFRVTRSE